MGNHNDNNRSKQKNPNNNQYYKDRGYKGGKNTPRNMVSEKFDKEFNHQKRR